MADGQVTRNTEIVKPNVRKVRTMIDGSVIGGFAGMNHVLSVYLALLGLTPYRNAENVSLCMHAQLGVCCPRSNG